MEPEISGSFVVEGFYRDVVGEFSTYKNLTVGGCSSHWVVPTPNLSSHVITPHVPLNSRFKFKVGLPKPCLPPTPINPESFKEGDPFESIVRAKEKWEDDLNTLTQEAKRGKKWAGKQQNGLTVGKVKKGDADKPIYTVNSILNVAKHLSNDPHPYFKGKYNWMGTGGCLGSQLLSGENVILHPSGNCMDTLCISRLEQQESGSVVVKSKSMCQLPLTNDQRIYQIVSKHVDSKGIACIRQEKVCSLVRFKKKSGTQIVGKTTLEIEEKDGVFTSIDLSHLNDNILCTLDSDQFLKLWDLSTSSCIDSVQMPRTDVQSNWGFIKFSNKSNELLAANRNTVFLNDQRMPLMSTRKEFSPKAVIDDCEEISLLMNSVNSPLVYVSTSHRLLSLDLRMGWQQRWTHLMQAPPMFGSVFCDSQKSEEVILLSSSIPDDSIAIVNTWKEGKAISEVAPVGMPSLGDVMLMANTRGKCLGPSFGKRLQMATTGLTLLSSEEREGFISLKTTAIGDIFSQQFQPATEMFDMTETAAKNNEIDTHLNTWVRWEEAHNRICGRIYPDLLSPTISNESVIEMVRAPAGRCQEEQKLKKWHATFQRKDKTKKEREDCHIKKEQVEEASEDSYPSYTELLCELGTYRDIMSQVLLEAWDTEGLTAKVEPTSYVETWLDNCPTPTPSDDESINSPRSPAPRLMSLRSHSKVKDNHDDSKIFKVPITPTGRPLKKIKRESSGF